jgi:phosphate transport system substrate-binding protein
MSHRLPLCLGSLLLLLGLASCGTAVAPAEPTTLHVAGSTSMLPLLADLSAAYGESHPHVRLEIEGGGSHLGLERLEMGEVDLAACSWIAPVAADTPSPYLSTPVAWDGIAVVVHPANPADDLTLLQLRSVYAGWTLGWQDVGGEEADLLVVSREDGSGTRATFEEQVMDGQSVTLTAVVMPSSTAVVEYVARHSTAIGYVSMSAAATHSMGDQGSGSDESGVGVKVLRIEGAIPTPDTVRSGVYHLTRPLYLATADSPGEEVRSFVDFALSPTGQAIVGQRYGRVR